MHTNWPVRKVNTCTALHCDGCRALGPLIDRRHSSPDTLNLYVHYHSCPSGDKLAAKLVQGRFASARFLASGDVRRAIFLVGHGSLIYLDHKVSASVFRVSMQSRLVLAATLHIFGCATLRWWHHRIGPFWRK